VLEHLKTTAVIALFLAAVMACVGCHSNQETTAKDLQGKIAFVSDRSDNLGIYVMNANGSNQKLLTNNSAINDYPQWSPDGKKIAFYTNYDGVCSIYVIDANSANILQLTDNSSANYNPWWSPDGTKIAFHSERDGNTEIYVMNADGSNQTRLTNNSVQDEFPSWSPDGYILWMLPA
jgi:Tol biopolymer transport system component